MKPGSGTTDECEALAEDLTAYLDGEIRGESRARLEAHLAACPSCRREIDRVGRVRDLVASALEPRPGGAAVADEGFANVLERIGADPGPTPTHGGDLAAARRSASRVRGRFHRRPGLGLGLSLAGASAIAAMAVLFANDSLRSTEVPPRTLVGAPVDGTVARRRVALAAKTPTVARSDVRSKPAATGPAAGPALAGGDPSRDLQVPEELRLRAGLFVDMDVVKRLDKLKNLEAVYQASRGDGGGPG